jgi:hypothetical protein
MSDAAADGHPRKARTKTEYVQPDDRQKIIFTTVAVIGPAFAIWCRLWHSWYARLTPELERMRAGVKAFATEHRIELKGEVCLALWSLFAHSLLTLFVAHFSLNFAPLLQRPIELEAFKKSRDAWVRGLFDSETEYKKTFEALLESGQVSEATSVAFATVVTIGAGNHGFKEGKALSARLELEQKASHRDAARARGLFTLCDF